MSKAENLLNNFTVDDTDLYTAEPSIEGHIVIDRDRFITVPESLKRIAVQGDKNIETVSFDCPRYWDEYDLFNMQICINFMRSDGYKSSYVAQNKAIDTIDTNIIHFTWTIDEDVTAYKGTLKFIVCAKAANAETGVKETAWNTEINNDMFISEGLECEEHVVEQNYAVIMQLLTRMDDAEKTIIDKYGEIKTLHTTAVRRLDEKIDFVEDTAIANCDGIRQLHTTDVEKLNTRMDDAEKTISEKSGEIEHLNTIIDDTFNRILPVNRYDGVSFDGYMTKYGEVVSDTGTHYTGYIPVIEGEVITVQSDDASYNPRSTRMFYNVAAFDRYKNLLPSFGLNSTPEIKFYSYTVPAGVAYIRISSSVFAREYNYYTNVAVVASSEVIPYEKYFDYSYGDIKPEKVMSATSQLTNAIKGHAKGEIVRIDNVSPVTHNINCWVHSKNLFNGVLKKGILISEAFDLDTTNSLEYFRTLIMYIPKPGTYTASFSVPVYISSIVKDGLYNRILESGTSYTFSVNDACVFGMSFRDMRSETNWNSSNTIQVEFGDVATEYEPYKYLTDVSISRFGKNILDISKIPTTTTMSGVTITRIGDQIKFDGTATDSITFFDEDLRMFGETGNKYTLSYIVDDGTVSDGLFYISVASLDTNGTAFAWLTVKPENKSSTSELSKRGRFFFGINKNTKFSDYRIRVQLELGDVATEYETSKHERYAPNCYGIVDVESISPSTTLTTNKLGAVIDCEYNKDATLIIKNLEDRLAALEAKTE